MARHWAEELALSYLQAQGYTLLAKNYSVRGGEIDLVMQMNEFIIFIEVKQRKNARFGSPAESIAAAKLERMRKVALHYLVAQFGRDDLPVRFDAVLLTGTRDRYRLEHLQQIL